MKTSSDGNIFRVTGHLCGASQITSLTIVYSTVYSGRSKKISKLRVTDLCEGNSPEFHTQRASNGETVSIWWRDHVFRYRIVLTRQEPYPHLGCHVHGGDDWQPLKEAKREIGTYSKQLRIPMRRKYDFSTYQTIIELLLQKSIPVANTVLMP